MLAVIGLLIYYAFIGDEFLVLTIVIYVIYLIMSCCTEMCGFAWNKTTYEETVTNVNKSIAARPKVTMKIECYHNEKRGDNTVRVVTHRASHTFEFKNWVDKSPPEEALAHVGDTFLIFRLYTHKDITFSSKAW